MRRLEHAINGVYSTLTYKLTAGEQQTSAVNAQNVAVYAINDRGFLETVLTQLQYYNPAVPGTLTTADGATGSYDRSFRMQSAIGLYIKNNFQVPVVVYVYRCWCQSNTNNTAVDSWASASNDASNSTAITTIYQQDPMDCYSGIKDTWKVKIFKKRLLMPGQQITCWQKRPWIGYDPSEYDNHAYSNQPGFKSFNFMVRIHGVASHDSTTTSNAGISPAGVDVIFERRGKVKYNSGGPSISYTYYTNSLDSMTTALVSDQVVDNQAYSAT